MIATMGALSIGMAAPALAKGEYLNKPYKVDKKSLKTDILVVGGGTAGVVAAIQAGRAGRKVIVVEAGSQLGGVTTTGGVNFPGIFHAWGRQVIGGIGWEIVQETVALNGDALPNFSVPHGRQHWKHQVRLSGHLYAALAEEKCLQAGVQLRYYETPVTASLSKDQWTVKTIGKGTETEIVCNQLIDCTGNAFVAGLAGYDRLRESVTQPGTLQFRIGGYDFESLDLEKLKALYEEEVKKGKLVKKEFRSIVSLLKGRGDNIQHIFGADSTTSETHTATNIDGRTSLLKMFRFLKTLPGLEDVKLEDMQTETAVRETYRIDGHYKITETDYVTGKLFDDAVSYSYYPIDVHDENGVVPDHLMEGVVPTVPLRALIPRKSRNFIIAGRCVSSDRLANSALRVQASCMGMGQAAGAAAALASMQNKTPLDVSMKELHALIRAHGGIIPG